MNYIISYDIAGLFLLVTLFLVYLHENNFPSRTNRIFYRVLLLSITAISFDLITIYTNQKLPPSFLWLNEILAIIHISCSNLISIMYFAFIISMTHEQHRFSIRHHVLLLIPTVFNFFAIITSPYTHFVMYYDSNYQYQHGFGLNVLYAITILYILLSVLEIVFNHKKLTKFHKICVLFYSLLLVIAAIIQSLRPDVLITGFGIAVSSLIVSFTLRNPLEFIDQKIGLPNSTAFKEFYFSRPELHKKCTFGLIHVTNFDLIQRIYGQKNAGYIMLQKWNFIKKELQIKHIFYITKDCYLIISKNKETVYEQLDYIHTFCNIKVKTAPENEQTENIHVKTDVFILEDFNIQQLKTSDYISNPIDKLLNLLVFVSRNIPESDSIRIINDVAFKMYEEKQNLRKCINKGIEDNSFEVFLQPIFNVHEKRFTGAESLLRLKDQDGNYISPALFIPEAEETGRIFEIGDISLRKTCEYIKNGNLRELGIEKVNINLSMHQCMHENIAEHLISILNQYQIPKEMICFEITETIMSRNPDYLLEVIQKLNNNQICFAVDDYGTGYSNTSRMLTFPFVEIKFDKSLIDAAVENKQNAECIKHMFAMIMCTKRLTLAEGVETKEMSDLMEEFGCDLIQGYYYSKPLPLPQFIETVTKINQRF